jgi:hypothetical protein
MYSSLRLVAILGLVVTGSIAADARRRSRIDLPIQVTADAPLQDNLATASDSDVVVEKLEMPPSSLVKEQTKEEINKKAVAANEDATLPADCSADNMSFELTTG